MSDVPAAGGPDEVVLAGGASPVEPAPDVRSWGWHYARVSALFLAVLLPLHVVRMLVTTDVARHTARSVSDRWADPLARALEGGALVLALTHAAAVLAPRLAARARSRRGGVVVTAGVWVVLGGLAAAVSFVTLTYDIT